MSNSQIIKEYLLNRKFWVGVCVYALVGVFLKVFAHVNILPPCLFTFLFGMRCPGCGLTTAFLHILHLDFKAAFEMNPMIFIVAPSFGFFAAKDFFKFKRDLPA